MNPRICPFMSSRVTTQTLVGEREELYEAPCLGERCALWVGMNGSKDSEDGSSGQCGMLPRRSN